MARGDHIFVRRFGGVYSHHGIDCGAGKVIHYTGYTPLQSEVRETSIEKFMNGGEVETRDYQEFEQLLLASEWFRFSRHLAGIASAHFCEMAHTSPGQE